MRRRQLIATIGVTGAVALAGCIGDGETPTEPEYGEWFGNTDNFDGFEDYTDTERVTVLVGTGDPAFQFDPPAIGVSPGTTVVFEWTGAGGDHNVEAENKGWNNPNGTLDEAGHTWERTFDSAGTHLYKCWPHEEVGMKGAIFVDAKGEFDYPNDGSGGGDNQSEYADVGESTTEPEYSDWFENVENFEEFADHTGSDAITVAVGAGDDGWQFDPPAISITPGTTVEWEWTGEGGPHNVVSENRDWENPGGTTSEAGHTWERTFEDGGTHLYKCVPHEGVGMKGAVFVRVADDE